MLSAVEVDAYLRRIGLERPGRPDAEALRALHRGHLASIPYENLDIQLRRPIDLSRAALFDKLVRRRRGGFCYEMNGLLALALRALGFDVTILEGGVQVESDGVGNWGNHMLMSVRLHDDEWLADVGLGDGFCEPLPLREGEHRQGVFSYRLLRLDDQTWRCVLRPRGSVVSFDFRTAPRRRSDFADRCRELSTSPDSSFVKTLAVQRSLPEAKLVLRARSFSRHSPGAAASGSRLTFDSAGRFAAALQEHFGLELSAAERDLLWGRACDQHRAWSAQAASES